jgi:putative Mg2+ transporter-C (MgtC) family protein
MTIILTSALENSSTICTLFSRLGVAVLVGGMLGLNRDLHGKAAGLRTHTLVTLGAAMATLVILNIQPFGSPTDPSALSHVLQGILTGIGFLGAGVIIRDTEGHVSGLTTAATIWVAAVMGILCGAGYWSLVLVSSLMIMAVLTLGKSIEKLAERLFRKNQPLSKEPPSTQ